MEESGFRTPRLDRLEEEFKESTTYFKGRHDKTFEKLSDIGEDIAYLRGKFEDVPDKLDELEGKVHGNDKKILGLSLALGTGAGAIGSFIKNLFIS